MPVRKALLSLLVILLGMAMLASDVLPGAAEIQLAQRVTRQPTFFERLFGPRQPQATPVRPRIIRKKPSQPIRPVEPAVPAIVVEEKDPNARKILVVGDYVAGGIAWGLDQSLAKETRLAVADRTNPSSGLVRDDHYDWNKALLGILNEEKPDVIVIALGTNDRQQIRVGGQRLAPRSPQWEEAYVKRVSGLVDTLKVYGRPFFWVSAPPMRANAASGDMAYLNTLYKPRVLAAGGHFIDIWNGFTNASGQFVASGPDIDGQVKALRSSDGINFTRAGRQKLAYYVEREIRRQTGIGAGTVDLLASTSQTSRIEIGPDGKKRLVGPVISLTDPLPGASEALAGEPEPMVYDPVSGTVRKAGQPPLPRLAAAPAPAGTPPAEKPETALHRLVVKGEPLPGAAGRVDDFTWPPGQRASQTFLEPEAPRLPSPDQVKATAAARAILTPISSSD